MAQSTAGPLAWQMHPPRLQNVPWAEEFPAPRTMTGEHVVERLSQAFRGGGAAMLGIDFPAARSWLEVPYQGSTVHWCAAAHYITTQSLCIIGIRARRHGRPHGLELFSGRHM
ncbi:uncharacterized protein BO80DRAFT_441472 [Aspergillus ibericus CBS 121593]|uniref:Uncharacterized protein n=1 Tax=Aspergillus ibericus CBS 121593 TaxID=1448316 RepID=A0A395H9G8_9EURO|nr:hypothetical protein BO80DRAFT_441472 [Aspergillus ibericus CBS 121593]RAL04601.1 hypothetical protein BO80DRAFT_441472 [Aspergillus ibericus CBS 121593]